MNTKEINGISYVGIKINGRKQFLRALMVCANDDKYCFLDKDESKNWIFYCPRLEVQTKGAFVTNGLPIYTKERYQELEAKVLKSIHA